MLLTFYTHSVDLWIHLPPLQQGKKLLFPGSYQKRTKQVMGVKVQKSVLFNIQKKMVSSFVTAQQNLIPKGTDS